jgi:multidrug efflux pump subunit AcrA (membrane-fusion protein)
MRDVAQFTGTLISKSRFVVAPKVSGRLEKLLVNIGDPVKDGDPVAVLDSAEYDQQVAQATAELEVSRANLADARSARDLAEAEYVRAKELWEQKVASEAERDQAKARYDAAKAKYDVADAQIKQRQAALNAAKVRQSYTRIHATWSEETPAPRKDQKRVVAERFIDAGSMLRANDPIVSIVQTDPVIAVVHVIEEDYPGIDIGQGATIRTDAWPDKTFPGTVVRKAPVLREESRQARVEIEIPNPEVETGQTVALVDESGSEIGSRPEVKRLLAPGMFVRVRVELAQREAATAVPAAAISRREGKVGVFVPDEEGRKANFVPVTTGITERDDEGEWVQIIEPAIHGEVVTQGQHLLETGGAITVVRGDAPPGARPAGGRTRRADP